jgi:hypothetical protein
LNDTAARRGREKDVECHAISRPNGRCEPRKPDSPYQNV